MADGYIMVPANNALRAEKLKTFPSWQAADAWLTKQRREGDTREMWVWSESEYQKEYEKRVAPHYKR